MKISILIISLNLQSLIYGYVFPCYYYYEPNGLTPELIPTDLCTHIILLGCIDETNLITEPLKKPFNCSNALEKFSNLREKNSKLILIISIGTNQDVMNKIVSNHTVMDQYLDSAVQLARKYNLQGIDFDWEFPCGKNKVLFSKMLQILRNKVGNKVILTAAIGAPLDLIQNCYELDALSKYLDLIHVMCYNYNTIFNNYTAYSSPLFARPEEIGFDATLNTNFTINYLIENGVPKEKIVVGLSADGHSFQLKNKDDNGFHADVTGVGFGAGWVVLSQICKTIKGGGVYNYDEIAQVLYVNYDDQWVNCGDVRSAIAKSKWVKANGLAGVFTWALNIDDLDNVCGYNTDFPLHSAIKKVLFES